MIGRRFSKLKKKIAVCTVWCALCVMQLALLTSCSDARTIPDDTLEDIITDVLLSEGVLASGVKFETVTPIDSIDFYSPVLRKYGYTIVDFRHTINVLAARKSNPLEGIMEHVVETIDKEALLAQFRYDISKRFDSLALAKYADTVYKLDTLILGSPQKYRIKLDSIEAGDYRIKMDYKSMLDYRLPQKSIKYYFADSAGKKSVEQTIWFNRSEELKTLDEVVTTKIDRDSLVVFFSQATINRPRGTKVEAIKDTSTIEKIAIIYTPSLEVARKRYYNSIFGKDFVVFSNNWYNNEQKFKKDSLPGPLGRQR